MSWSPVRRVEPGLIKAPMPSMDFRPLVRLLMLLRLFDITGARGERVRHIWFLFFQAILTAPIVIFHMIVTRYSIHRLLDAEHTRYKSAKHNTSDNLDIDKNVRFSLMEEHCFRPFEPWRNRIRPDCPFTCANHRIYWIFSTQNDGYFDAFNSQ